MFTNNRNLDGIIWDEQLANPAAGANFTYNAKAGFREKLLMLKFDLTCSAVAGTRIPNLNLLSSSVGNFRLPSNQILIAGAVMSLYFYTGLTTIIVDPGSAWACVPLPSETWIRTPGSLSSLIESIDAGDQISGIHIRTWCQASLNL